MKKQKKESKNKIKRNKYSVTSVSPCVTVQLVKLKVTSFKVVNAQAWHGRLHFLSLAEFYRCSDRVAASKSDGDRKRDQAERKKLLRSCPKFKWLT